MNDQPRKSFFERSRNIIYRVEDSMLYRAAFPFMIVLLAALLIITCWLALSLFLIQR